MNKKIIITGILVFLLLTILSSGCISEDKKEEKEEKEEGTVEASLGDIKISNVHNNPVQPKVGDDIDYYATVTAVPSGHSVVVITEEYDGSKIIGSSSLNMRKTSGNEYKAGDILSGTGYETGITIKYWVKIYSVGFDDVDDISEETPILESKEHSYVLQ